MTSTPHMPLHLVWSTTKQYKLRRRGRRADQVSTLYTKGEKGGNIQAMEKKGGANPNPLGCGIVTLAFSSVENTDGGGIV